MALAGYIHLEDLARREVRAGDLALGQVGLLRLGGEDLHDDALALRVGVERRALWRALFWVGACGALLG